MNVKPYTHQNQAVAFAQGRQYAALFMETGTGKTLVALECFERWYKQGLRKFICIVPNTLTGTWIAEAKKFGFALPIARLESGPVAKRLKLIESGRWEVLVCNYEALRNETIRKALLAVHPQGSALDEIQRCKDRRTQQTKGVREINVAVRENGGSRLGLTGTPVVHSPLDLWSIFDVLDPSDDPRQHPLGYGNYWAFEQGVAIKTNHPRIPMLKLYEFPAERLAKLKSRVALLAFEARKDDCLDLPPRSFVKVPLIMDPEQQRIYDALRTDYVAFLEDTPPPASAASLLADLGVTSLSDNEKAKELYAQALSDTGPDLLATDNRVSVTFATTLLIRLQQLASGHIKTDDGLSKLLDHNIKVDWLTEMLPMLTDESWDNKTIIFTRYHADIEILTALCKKLKIGYVALTGANGDPLNPDGSRYGGKDANTAVELFQNNPGKRVFIGNVQIASTGITLTAANSVVFYNNSFAAGDRAQAIDRPYRIGQLRKVTYYDLLCKGTIDEQALANIEGKQALATATVSNLLETLKYTIQD